jgi:hypothetical protein
MNILCLLGILIIIFIPKEKVISGHWKVHPMGITTLFLVGAVRASSYLSCFKGEVLLSWLEFIYDFTGYTNIYIYILNSRLSGLFFQYYGFSPRKICSLNFAVPSEAWVAHAYNSSYLGGWDWEDHGLKPAPGQIVYKRPSPK